MSDTVGAPLRGWRSLLRFRRAGTEALIVGAGHAMAALGSMATVRLLTGALPPAEYGIMALGASLGALGNITLLTPLTFAASRFFAPAREAGDVRGFVQALARLTWRAVAAVAAIALLILVTISLVASTRWNVLIVVAFLHTALMGVGMVVDGVQNAARQRTISAIHNAVGSWLRALVAVALIRITGITDSAMALAGYAAASALVLFSQLLFFRKTTSGHSAVTPDAARWSQAMLTYGWPFASWGVFTWARLASDRWALGAFGSAADVGLYTAAYQLGFAPMLILATLVSQVLAPIFFARAGDGSDATRVNGALRLNTRATMAMFAFTVVATVVAAVLHAWIGRLLLAPQYRGVTHFIPWMILAGGASATAQLATMSFMISNRSRELTVPKIVSNIAGTALSFVGARWFGIAGVVAASLLYMLLYMAWIWAVDRYAPSKRTA